MTQSPPREVVLGAVLEALHAQGFEIRSGEIAAPTEIDKDKIRSITETTVKRAVAKARPNLARHEPRLVGHLADGSSLDPFRIEPRLVEVQPNSEEELLFRWARLHWSVPTAAGYGRRLRLLVVDDRNGKLIGLIGLGDGVFSLPARDRWIGWSRERRLVALRGIMHAHVLGAVPPYSFLLGGKLVALLAASTSVRRMFAARYARRKTLIAGREQDGRLAMITTTGALGRASVYNRLRYRPTPKDSGRLVFERAGFAKSSAQAYFGDDLYAMLESYAIKHCAPTVKRTAWGRGFRSRREVIDKALTHLGLDPRALTNGVTREIWCARLAPNATAYLRGDDDALEPFPETVEDFTEFWRNRWLLPRAGRDRRYESFAPDSWRLWGTSNR